MVDFLQNKIYEEMDKNIPWFILSNTKRKNPWVTYEIKKYMVLQRRFKKIYIEKPTDYNKNKYLNVKIILDKIILNAKQKYYSNISKNLKDKNYSSRKFWNICNMLLKRKLKQNVGDIIYNRKIYKNDKDKVTIIGDYFAEQVQSDTGYYDNNINYTHNFITDNKYSFPDISCNMIDNIIKN